MGLSPAAPVGGARCWAQTCGLRTRRKESYTPVHVPRSDSTNGGMRPSGYFHSLRSGSALSGKYYERTLVLRGGPGDAALRGLRSESGGSSSSVLSLVMAEYGLPFAMP